MNSSHLLYRGNSRFPLFLIFLFDSSITGTKSLPEFSECGTKKRFFQIAERKILLIQWFGQLIIFIKNTVDGSQTNT